MPTDQRRCDGLLSWLGHAEKWLSYFQGWDVQMSG